MIHHHGVIYFDQVQRKKQKQGYIVVSVALAFLVMFIAGVFVI